MDSVTGLPPLTCCGNQVINSAGNGCRACTRDIECPSNKRFECVGGQCIRRCREGTRIVGGSCRTGINTNFTDEPFLPLDFERTVINMNPLPCPIRIPFNEFPIRGSLRDPFILNEACPKAEMLFAINCARERQIRLQHTHAEGTTGDYSFEVFINDTRVGTRTLNLDTWSWHYFTEPLGGSY